MPKTGKAIVDGVNMAIRHERQTQTTQGGRLPKAMPIDISNLSLMDKTVKPPAWVSKLRVAKKYAWLRQRGMLSMLDKANYTPRLQDEYKTKIRAAMKEEFGYKNDMMIPKLEKIVLNIGAGALLLKIVKRLNRRRTI